MVSVENHRARQLLEQLVAWLTPSDHEPTLEELRAGLELWMTTNFPAPPELRTEPVDAGGVSCVRASMPGTSAGRTIFYLHGGSYLLGSTRGYHGFAAALSAAANATVVLVDYRLAPENPHPAALHGALTAYRWAVQGASDPAGAVVPGTRPAGVWLLPCSSRCETPVTLCPPPPCASHLGWI